MTTPGPCPPDPGPSALLSGPGLVDNRKEEVWARMVGDYESAAKLHRHHVEVLTRIEAQLRRYRDAIDAFDSFRQHPAESRGHTVEDLPHLP